MCLMKINLGDSGVIKRFESDSLTPRQASSSIGLITEILHHTT